MKLSLIPQRGSIRSLVNKIPNVQIGLGDDIDRVLFEDLSIPLEPAVGKQIANSCQGLRTILAIPEATKRIHKELGVQEGTKVTAIYSLFSGEIFSDWIELDFSCKLFSGNIGPDIIFTQGCALKLEINPLEAIARMSTLRDTLQKLDYRGEIIILINDNYTISSIHFGHFFGAFALMSELSELQTSNMIGFIFGDSNSIRLSDDIALGNLVWQLPYPARMLEPQAPISAPQSAEKHIWRLQDQRQELALLTAKGDGAYKNCWRRIGYTSRNLKLSDPNLCYRNDYGNSKRTFLFSEEKFEKFKTAQPEYRHSRGQTYRAGSVQNSPKSQESPSSQTAESGRKSSAKEESKEQVCDRST